MSTSFPYLKIARDRGMQYGDVIRYAELIDSWIATNDPRLSLVSEYDVVFHAVQAERTRRYEVTHE